VYGRRPLRLCASHARPLVLEAIERAGGLGGVRVVVLCDLETPFERAAEVFGPQKGAGAGWVLDALGVDRRLAAAAGAITGEGRLDAQTLAGQARG
jgi:glycerate kinase